MSELMAQYVGQDNESLHKWQLDMREDLEHFRLHLQGFGINPNFNGDDPDNDDPYIKINEDPFCNELGAIQIRNRLMAVVNKAGSDTNLTQERINKELKEFDIDVSVWIATRRHDFGIRPKDYNAVCEMLVEYAISIFHRSIKGWKGGLINAPGNIKEVHYASSQEQGVSVNNKRKLGIFGI